MENKTIKKNPLSFQIDPNLFQQATDEEKAQIVTQRESVSFMRDAMRRLVHNKMAMICLVILVVITLIAIIVPMIYPYTYTQQDVTGKYLKPFEYSAKEQARINAGQEVFPHIMGTDNLGRDYAIRVIYGTRISLMVGFISALIVVFIGILYGAVSGYFGGKVVLKAIEQPKTDWNSPREVFEDVLKHEQLVTSKINALLDVAEDVHDRAAVSFLDWYLKEQVEEESNVGNVLKTLNLICDDKQCIYMLDKELGARTFTSPVIG